jgi:hypothetical protein
MGRWHEAQGEGDHFEDLRRARRRVRSETGPGYRSAHPGYSLQDLVEPHQIVDAVAREQRLLRDPGGVGVADIGGWLRIGGNAANSIFRLSSWG